jgi:20S proteasome alpha/beta subunit
VKAVGKFPEHDDYHHHPFTFATSGTVINFGPIMNLPEDCQVHVFDQGRRGPRRRALSRTICIVTTTQPTKTHHEPSKSISQRHLGNPTSLSPERLTVIWWLCWMLLLNLLIPVTVHASQAAGTETLVGIVGKDFVLLMADSSVSQSIALTASNLDKIAVLSDPFPNDKNMKTLCKSGKRPRRQMAIAAAAAGDAADSDRLLSCLRSFATLEEYQNGWGCDVQMVPCSNNDSPKPVSYPGLDVDAMAHLARRIIADSLRSSPLNVCLLIAGMHYVPRSLYDPDSPPGETRHAKSDVAYISNNSNRSKNFPSLMVQRQINQAWGAISDKPETAIEERTSDLSTQRYEPKLYWLDEYGSLQRVQYGAHGLGANFLLSILDQGYRNDMSLDEAVALADDCFRELRKRYLINSPQPPCVKCINFDGITLIQQRQDDDSLIQKQ